jgi:hypothetical protein
MKRRRLVPMIVTAICCAALGAGVTEAALAAPAAGARAPHGAGTSRYSEVTVVLTCQDRAQVRPRTLILACADENDYLTQLSWASWGPKLAKATGVQKENDCMPDCAAGHFHSYPVNVVFWDATAARPGEQRFTKVTLRYRGARPPVNGRPGPVTVTMPLYP